MKSTMKNTLSYYAVTVITASILAACTVQPNMDDSDLKANKLTTLPLVDSKIQEDEQNSIPQSKSDDSYSPAEILVTDTIFGLANQSGRKKETTIIAEKFSSVESRIGAQDLESAPLKQKARKLEYKDNMLPRTLASPAYEGAFNRSLNEIRLPVENIDRENYAHLDENPTKLVAEHPVSTFSIDVDTGSYANVRRFLQSGHLPRTDAVRIEELLNYFSYNYPQPNKDDTPFSVTTEIAPTPWNKDTYLLHVGVKGINQAQDTLPPSNLVFLIDVSGSMQSDNKLGLLKTSLKMLTKKLRKEDTLSIVVYAGASGVVLEPVAGNQSAKINFAIDALTAGGSTNGGAGIRLAYAMAKQSFVKGGINRVILATDGDFNVGTVNFEALINLVENERKSGISLTTLGFGAGNYNDKLMEQIADKGNGNYHYIDTLNEAQKVLVDEMTSTLQTIAKDVKIQIEFNKSKVSEYRLIGYENRVLQREDFNNDKVDAGEIGAGHTVTALYEIALTDGKGKLMDNLRYQGKNENKDVSHGAITGELAFLKLRYKAPDADKSKLLTFPLYENTIVSDMNGTSDRFRFSAAVAAFGQVLKGGKYTHAFDYKDILELARKARGEDNFGYRGEFIKLVNLAKSLS